jgi:replicative DNA helicase
MEELTRRAERALLGAMIAAPWLMAVVRVRPREFADRRHRELFGGILAARAALGRSRDTRQWRQAIVRAAPAVTPADLDDLVADCPFPHHGVAYAGLVIRAWAVRKAGEAAETIATRARLLDYGSRDIIRAARAEGAEGLEAATVARHMKDVAAAMHAHVSALGRTPPSVDVVPADSSPEQVQREESVLAGLLTQPPDRRHQILSVLRDQDIRDPYRRAVLRAVRDMHAAGMAVDCLTLDWQMALSGQPLVPRQAEDRDGETYDATPEPLAICEAGGC